jgi:hypothetical protein
VVFQIFSVLRFDTTISRTAAFGGLKSKCLIHAEPLPPMCLAALLVSYLLAADSVGFHHHSANENLILKGQ